jgi:ABC-type nitrate/sulfonate/bicarbonate transport system substrate-binding protein
MNRRVTEAESADPDGVGNASNKNKISPQTERNVMFNRLKSTLKVLAAAAALTLPAMAANAQDKFTLMLPVKSVLQYHPFYIAQELGYFKQENLDVRFEVANGSSAALRQLIAGNADAALPSPGAFLNAVAQGNDLRWIFSYEYANIFTLVTPANGPVKTIADLKGRSVGVSELSGGEVPLVRAVLRKAGLGENDTKILPVGEGSALTVQALQSGQVNAYSSSLFDVAAIEAAGHQMRVILPPDAQLYPANGIATTADVLNKKRDQLVRFGRALAKGIAYVKADPNRALTMAKKLGPEEFENENFIKYGWQAIQTLTTPPESLKSQPIGAHYTEGFKNYHDFLRAGKEEEGALPRDVDLTKALDSSLLKDMNNFDRNTVK